MIGRATALLVDIAVEVWPSGYRVTARPGSHHRRGVDLLARDVDALDEALGENGARPAAGEDPGRGAVDARRRGRAAQREPGADRPGRGRGVRREPRRGRARPRRRARPPDRGRRRRADRRADAARRPRRHAVHPERLRHGARRCPAPEARAALATLVSAAREAGAVDVVVHCCHPTPPLALLGATGADAVAVDLTALERSSAVLDALGELWDAGTELWLGIVPSTDPAGEPPSIEGLARPALDRRRPSGLRPRSCWPTAASSPPPAASPGRPRAGRAPRWPAASSWPGPSRTRRRPGDPGAVK